MQTIESSFKDYAVDRASALVDHFAISDKHYSIIMSKCNDCLEKLLEQIPHEVKPALLEFEENITLLHGLSQDIMYLQGIKDGARLIKNLMFE